MGAADRPGPSATRLTDGCMWQAIDGVTLQQLNIRLEQEIETRKRLEKQLADASAVQQPPSFLASSAHWAISVVAG